MKRIACILSALAAAGLLAPAEAQQKRSPTEITLVNNRQAALNEFDVTNAEGRKVGEIKAPLAAGKRVSIKLTKGAPCVLTVSATFADEFENNGAQIDACKDRIVRFGN